MSLTALMMGLMIGWGAPACHGEEAAPVALPQVPAVPAALEPPVAASVLEAQLSRFAVGGGGSLYIVAICAQKSSACPFYHWGGFYTSGPLESSDRPVERPASSLLLVNNHPFNRESRNQNVVEELVRWESGGRLTPTGIRYSKWGTTGLSSEAFTRALKPLLEDKSGPAK